MTNILSQARWAIILGWLLVRAGVVCGDEPEKADAPNLLTYRDDQGRDVPAKDERDWARRREQIVAAMQEVMGPLPDESRRSPLEPEVVEEVRGDGFTRQKLTFAVEPGDRLAAYLFIPDKRDGKLPAMLCLHPTNQKLGKGIPAGLGDDEDRKYAVHLARRGYVTLAPDYVGSGDSRFEPYKNGYASATMKGIWNHMRCVDLLVSRPEVDAERIGAIGHSLGGHNSMFVGVFDERIKCVVSNCGFNSFHHYMGGNLAGWSHSGYMPRIGEKYGSDPRKMPFDFPEVVAALAPRAFLASSPLHDDNFPVAGVKPCMAAAAPVYELLGAKEKLAANYPDCGHDFPEPVREVAYAWLDRWLKP